MCEGLSAVFGTIAVFTGQTHWEREEAECLPIAVPLTRMINRMPAKQIAKLYELIDPAFLIGGLIEVVGPSVRVELERRQPDTARRIQGPVGGSPAGNTNVSGANEGHAGSSARNGGGIPTANAPFIGKDGRHRL